MGQQRRSAPAPNTARSRSNRMQRRRWHISIPSAASQENKHHIETCSTVLRAGVSPKSTIWVESQFRDPQCAHLRSRTTEGRDCRTWTWLAVCGSHGVGFCSKTPINVRSFHFEFRKEMLHDLVRHNTTVFSRVTRSCPALSVTHVCRAALARSVTDMKHQIPSRKHNERTNHKRSQSCRLTTNPETTVKNATESA